MRPNWRKILWLTVGLLILAGLLYRFRGVTMLGGFNWQKLGRALEGTDIPLLLLSVVSIYASYALRALRWERFSRYMGKPTFLHVYNATLMGFTAIFVLGRAGEPVRPLLIARKDNLPVADSFGVYVVERIFDTSATAALAIGALLEIPKGAIARPEQGPLLADARTAGWILFMALGAIVAGLVYFRLHGSRLLAARLEGLETRGGWRGKLATLLNGFSEGLQAIRSPADLSIAIFYTTVHWLDVALCYYLVLRSFNSRLGDFDFQAALLVLAFTMVGSVIQLPAVGGGAQVASFLVLSVILGVEKEPAAAAAIALWLVTFAGVCLAGMPMLLREGWSMGELRQMARQEDRRETRGAHARAEQSSAKEMRKPR